MATYSSEEIHAKIKVIIDTPSNDTWNFHEIDELSKLYDLASSNNDVQAIKELQWEVDLLCPVFDCSNKWEDYLEGKDEITKPYSRPHCTWKTEAVDYYKKRFHETSYSLAKARYAFAIMTMSSGKEKYQFAEASYDSWLSAAEGSVKGERREAGIFISRLDYGIALRIALGFGMGAWIERVLESMCASISKLEKSNDINETLPLLKLIVINFDSIQKSKADKNIVDSCKQSIIDLLHLLIDQSRKSGDGHFEQEFVLCLREMVDDNERYVLMKRAAEIELNHGKIFSSSLVRFTFMEKALSIFREMQDTININQEETQRLIDDLIFEMKKIDLKSEMKVISSNISLSEIISKFEDALKKDPEHILSRILHENYGLIDKIEATNQAIAQKKEFPLQFFLPVKVIGNDGVIRTHCSEESILDYKARSNITLGVKVTCSMLWVVINDLKQEIISNNELNEILAHPAICDIKPMIDRGIGAVLGEQNDPIIASHLLVPYIEEIIRRVVVLNGLTDSVVGWERQLGTEEKTLAIKSVTLGGLLNNEDVRQILGTKFSDSIKTFLIDLDQINYRNLLLHGLMTSKDIESCDSAFVVYSILKLINMLPGVPIKH